MVDEFQVEKIFSASFGEDIFYLLVATTITAALVIHR